MNLVQGLERASWWEDLVLALGWVELGLVPQSAGPGQWVCFGAELSMTSGSLSADGWSACLSGWLA